MTMDIKDFYLGTPLKRYEYIRIQYNIIPDKIKEQYHLQAYKHNEYVYFAQEKCLITHTRKARRRTTSPTNRI